LFGGTLELSDVVLEHDSFSSCIGIWLKDSGSSAVTFVADKCEFNCGSGVWVANNGSLVKNVIITNSNITSMNFVLFVQHYIGDGNRTEEMMNTILNIDIYNNNNTLVSISPTGGAPIRYGFKAPVYFDEFGNIVE